MSAVGAQQRPWRIFGLLAVTQFMVVLDAGIVYVALPSIQRDLGFSPTGLAWVMDAYLLAFGGLMLVGGRAADLLGRKRMLIGGLVVFLVGSLACGLAGQAWELVTARVVQGVAAAVVSPAAMALVTDTFEDGPDRHRAMGVFAGVGGLAGASGVLFGGLLTSIAWQWAFLVNVPISIVLLVVAQRMVPVRPAQAHGGVDVFGGVLGTGGLCLLLYGVLRGGADGWATAGTWLVLAVAVVLIAAFTLRQLRAVAPLIPRSLFRVRSVVLGNAANAVTGLLMFGIFFVVTLYLQQVRDYGPLAAALRTMPISILLFVGSQVTIRLFATVRPPHVLACGLGLQAVGLAWWAAALDPHANIVTSFLLPGMLWGFGLGASIVAAFVVCTSGLRGEVQGAASGLVSTTLQAGGATGVAVLGTVAGDRTTGLLARHTASLIDAMAAGHAYAFGVCAVLALLAVPCALLIGPSAPHITETPVTAAIRKETV